MASETWINDNGTPRLIREIWINDNGTARRIQEIWVNDSGTARKIFAGDQITIADVGASSDVTSPSSATATYRLTSAGNIEYTTGSNTINDQGDWITPQTNMASYECRMDVLSGTFSSGTTGAWMSLSTTRTWTKLQSVNGSSAVSGTLQIRRTSDGTVMDSATITLTAKRLPP